MSKSVPKATAARRRALLAALGGAPAIAAILMTRGPAQKKAAAAVPAPKQAEPERAGYHETEHIRKYYRSVEF